jgi:hypothetical protein
VHVAGGTDQGAIDVDADEAYRPIMRAAPVSHAQP